MTGADGATKIEAWGLLGDQPGGAEEAHRGDGWCKGGAILWEWFDATTHAPRNNRGSEVSVYQ